MNIHVHVAIIKLEFYSLQEHFTQLDCNNELKSKCNFIHVCTLT